MGLLRRRRERNGTPKPRKAGPMFWLGLIATLISYAAKCNAGEIPPPPAPQQVEAEPGPMGWLPAEAQLAQVKLAPQLGEGVPGPMGWAGPEPAKEARQKLAAQLPELEIVPQALAEAKGKKVVLWSFTRLIHGKHLPTFRQQVGDCVSFGTANAIMYSMATNLAIIDPNARWRQLYQPYIYGISRVQIGGGRLRGDGSVGSWAAAGVQKYGILAADEDGVPEYSGSIARTWGAKPGPPQKFIDIATKSKPEARLVTTWPQAIEALSQGWAIAVCSGQGFRMMPTEANERLEGRPQGSWAHCMAFIGYDDRPGKEALYCLNSWGESAHGKPSDYARLDGAPPGGFWVLKSTAERMLSGRDSYAYSFNGFERRNVFPLDDKGGSHGNTVPDSGRRNSVPDAGFSGGNDDASDRRSSGIRIGEPGPTGGRGIPDRANPRAPGSVPGVGPVFRLESRLPVRQMRLHDVPPGQLQGLQRLRAVPVTAENRHPRVGTGHAHAADAAGRTGIDRATGRTYATAA